MSFPISEYSKAISLSLIVGVLSISAFAGPATQSSETIESLSKVKIVRTVNGQPGSIQELAANGKIKIISNSYEQPSSEIMSNETSTNKTITPTNTTSEIPASKATN